MFRKVKENIHHFILRWLGLLSAGTTAVFLFLFNLEPEGLEETNSSLAGILELILGQWVFMALVISALVSFLASAYRAAVEPTIVTLRKQLEIERQISTQVGENILIFFKSLMKDGAERIKMPREGKARISFYYYVQDVDCFVLCGRFSWDPFFEKKGRTTFPASQGCISKGWRHDWHFDNQVPDDDAEAASYHLLNYEVPEEVTANMKMKAKLFAAKKVLDRTDGPVGVIVVESLERELFEERPLKLELEAMAASLGPTVDVLREHIPTPQEAKAVGL